MLSANDSFIFYSNKCFSKFSIKLPRLDSEEFIFLSNSCLGVRDEVLANEASDSIIFSRK